MRESLDHCVKCTICETFCPVSNVTPLFPGPKYVGPQAERFRVARRAVARRLARLLLGLRHLHAGLPAGRAHRGDQHAGARRAAGERRASRCATALLGAPDAGRPARHAGRAARQLDAAQPPAAARRSSGDRASTAARRCRSSPGRTFQALGARAHRAAGDAARRLLPRLRHELLRAAARRDDRRAARAQRLPRSRCPSRTAAGCRCSPTGCSTTRAATCTRLAARLAPYARDGVDIVGTSTSCTLMLKREALEILGMEDDPDLRVVSDARLRHLRVPARDARARRAQHRLPAAAARPSPTTRRASSRATGSASPRSTCSRWCPGCASIESDADCCGVAGTYGLKKEKYDIAMKVGAGLFDQIADGAPGPAPSATPRPAAGRSSTRRASAPCTRSRCSTAPPGLA